MQTRSIHRSIVCAIRISANVVAVTVACIAAVPTLQAQSAQKFAFQAAGLVTSINGTSSSSTIGYGVEPQLRFNRVASSESAGALSIGIGGQYTQHSQGPSSLTLAGIFVEPRWVLPIASSRVYPYLAGRFAVLQQSSNFGSASKGSAFGGGGGFAVRISSAVNFDVGAAVVRQSFSDFRYSTSGGAVGFFKPFTTYAAKAGLSVGFP